MDRSTEPTLSNVQRLSEQLARLKLRHQRISQDLRDRTVDEDILEIKQLEQELLVFDMKKIERRIVEMQPQKTMQSIIDRWLEKLSSRTNARAPRRRYYVQHKPIHLL